MTSQLTEIALQMLGTIERMELIIPEITGTIRKALEEKAALAKPEPPTDEELISPIMWMLDECVYDNDKGEIAQSLRELIARWGQS